MSEAIVCRVCGARTNAWLCKDDGVLLERAIGDMTSLMHEVSVLATGQARVYRSSRRTENSEEERVWDDEQADIPAWLRTPGGRVALPATRLMVRLDARELLWEAGNTLSTWARHLAESNSEELPNPDALVGWLLGHVNAMRFDEAAAEIYDEIMFLHSRMTRAVDRSPSRVYAGPCHADTAAGRCERALYGWPAADEIVCDGYASGTEYDVGCRTAHTASERRDWLVAELEDSLLPLEFWREWLPRMMTDLVWPNRSTYWRWIEHKRLNAKTEVAGVEWFRGGDVIDLVRREQPRIRGNTAGYSRRTPRSA